MTNYVRITVSRFRYYKVVTRDGTVLMAGLDYYEQAKQWAECRGYVVESRLETSGNEDLTETP